MIRFVACAKIQFTQYARLPVYLLTYLLTY